MVYACILLIFVNVLIGKLLREVKPELMDSLILATKDGDWSRLQAVSGLEAGIFGDDYEESDKTEYEEEEKEVW